MTITLQKLQIPSGNGICGSALQQLSATPNLPNHQPNDPNNFPQNGRELTLDIVKRIWLSYPPISLNTRCLKVLKGAAQTEEEFATDGNALGLDLDSTSAINRLAQKSITSPLPEEMEIQPAINMDTAMSTKRETGEVSDDIKGLPGSNTFQAPNQSTSYSDLGQARSTLLDSFWKSLKSRDPQSTLSRDQVYQKYVAHMNDNQLHQLVSIGKDVLDDLATVGKLNDMKRKSSASPQASDRPVKRHLEDNSDHTPQQGDVSILEDPSLSVVSESPKDTSMSIVQNGHSQLPPPQPAPPAPPPPIILMDKEGRPHASTIEATFDLDDVLFNFAERWTKHLETLSPIEPCVQIFLCSIPKSKLSVEDAHSRNSPSSYSAEDLSSLETIWPSKGGLFVLLNHDIPEKARTWTPQTFTRDSPRLDITTSVASGRNSIRLIQLHDHSSYKFFLLAVPRIPSEAECRYWQYWVKTFGEYLPGKVQKIQLKIS